MKYQFDTSQPLHIFFNVDNVKELDGAGEQLKVFSYFLESSGLNYLEVKYDIQQYFTLLSLLPDELSIYTWVHPNIKKIIDYKEHVKMVLMLVGTLKEKHKKINFELISRHEESAPDEITDKYTVYPITILNELERKGISSQKVGEIRGNLIQENLVTIESEVVENAVANEVISKLILEINKGYKNFVGQFHIQLQSQKNSGVVTDESKWIKFLFPSQDFYIKPFEENLFWNTLPRFHSLERICKAKLEKPITNDFLDNIKEGLEFDTVNHFWKVDFNFFRQISNRFSDKEKTLTASMMYLIHETVHFEKHGFSSQTVNGESKGNPRAGNDMGNYPNCIEEADYQADVYAILTCLSFTKYQSGQNNNEFKYQETLLQVIELAVETTFSFIQRIPFSRNQVRRINRTLIWVFIHQIIKREIITENLKQFEQIINVLSKKPVIEIYGPAIYSVDKRTFYNLKEMKSDLWLGTFYNNKIKRFSMPKHDTDKIIEGIRFAKFNDICDGMSSFFEFVFTNEK